LKTKEGVMRRRGWIVPALALIGVALVAPRVQARAGADGDIAGAVASMRAALQRGDARTLASFYTEDADLAGPVSVKGRAAIEQHMETVVRQGIRDVRLQGQETFAGADFTAGRAAFFDRTGARVAVLTTWAGGHRDVSFPVRTGARVAATRKKTGERRSRGGAADDGVPAGTARRSASSRHGSDRPASSR
jgi:uncharacterized protein (TIGR02246 family)